MELRPKCKSQCTKFVLNFKEEISERGLSRDLALPFDSDSKVHGSLAAMSCSRVFSPLAPVPFGRIFDLPSFFFPLARRDSLLKSLRSSLNSRRRAQAPPLRCQVGEGEGVELRRAGHGQSGFWGRGGSGRKGCLGRWTVTFRRRSPFLHQVTESPGVTRFQRDFGPLTGAGGGGPGRNGSKWNSRSTTCAGSGPSRSLTSFGS